MNDSELLSFRHKFNMLYIDPLCGWEWVKENEHKLDDWTPQIELSSPGIHYKFSVKDGKTLKEVSKMMREK